MLRVIEYFANGGAERDRAGANAVHVRMETAPIRSIPRSDTYYNKSYSGFNFFREAGLSFSFSFGCLFPGRVRSRSISVYYTPGEGSVEEVVDQLITHEDNSSVVGSLLN